MKEIKNKIITISGEPASGKSTIVKGMKEKYEKMGYNVHIITTGKIFRERAKKEYLKMYPDRTDANLADIQEDVGFAGIRKKIDEKIDGDIAQIGKDINSEERPNDVYIIDSRLAWSNIPSSYAVRVTVDEKIAGKRVYNDQTRGAEDSYASEEDAIKKTKQRKLGEIERFKKQYNGLDLSKKENYDLIVDSSYSNSEEIADIIINGEKAYREGEYYPKNWSSPVMLLSTQRERDTNGQWIERITSEIQKYGYDPLKGTLDVVEKNGVKFLLDGNHRTMAALSTGKTVLPYTLIEDCPEYMNISIEELYSDLAMERIYSWKEGIEYYGGKKGKIEQLKNLNVLDFPGVEKIPIARKQLKLDEQVEEER